MLNANKNISYAWKRIVFFRVSLDKSLVTLEGLFGSSSWPVVEKFSNVYTPNYFAMNFFQIKLRAHGLSLNIGTPLMQLAAVDVSFDYVSITIFQSSSKQSFTSDIVIIVYTQNKL